MYMYMEGGGGGGGGVQKEITLRGENQPLDSEDIQHCMPGGKYMYFKSIVTIV